MVLNQSQVLHRFEDYNFGIDSSRIIRVKIDSKRLLSHFGYDENDSIAETFGFQDKYMMIFKLDRIAPLIFPRNVRAKSYQWTKKDFAQLRTDLATAQIYVNGDFEVLEGIWKVKR